MSTIAGVGAADFGPESSGVIHVASVGELVEDDIVAERLWELHKADIEGDSAAAATRTPARAGVGEAVFDVFVAVGFSEIFEAVGEVVLGFLGEEFFLSVAGALSRGVF